MSVYTYVNLDGYYNHYPIQCTGYNCPNFYDPNTGGSITPLKTIHSEGIVCNYGLHRTCTYNNDGGGLKASKDFNCELQAPCEGMGCIDRSAYLNNGYCYSCPSPYHFRTYDGTTPALSVPCVFNCYGGQVVDPTSSNANPTCIPCSSYSDPSAFSYAFANGLCNPTKCNLGYGYSTDVYSGQAYCTACGDGQFAPDGNSACMACPAGQYPDNTLRGCAVPNCYPGSQPINGGCGRCPSGQFSPGGSTQCQECPTGQISSPDNSQCYAPYCPPSQGVVAGVGCQNCNYAAREFSPGGTGVLCQLCPENQKSSGTGTYCVNLQCSSGTAPVDSVCTQCPAGSASPGGLSACTACSATQAVSSDGSACIDLNCPPGQGISNQACVPCAQGLVSAGGSATCSSCDSLSQASPDQSTCQPIVCQPGYGISGGSCQLCDYDGFSYSPGGPKAVCSECNQYTYDSTLNYYTDATYASTDHSSCIPFTCAPGTEPITSDDGGTNGACQSRAVAISTESNYLGSDASHIYCPGGDRYCASCPFEVSADGTSCPTPDCAPGTGIQALPVDSAGNPMSTDCLACADGQVSAGGPGATCSTCDDPSLVPNAAQSKCVTPASAAAGHRNRRQTAALTPAAIAGQPAAARQVTRARAAIAFKGRKRRDTWA